MSEKRQSVPVIVTGPDPAGRYACFQRLLADLRVRVERDCASIDESLVEHVEGEGHAGVVVLSGRLQGLSEDLTLLVRNARQRLPEWPVLVVSQPPPLTLAQIAGWLAFGSSVDLAAAVLVAASGGWVSDRVASLASRKAGGVAMLLPFDGNTSPGLLALTSREREVLSLMAQGLSNPDIARALEIATDTVKAHVKHIMTKLNVRDRTAAAVLATQARIA
jgi:DNA-binding NarL/FixJ family response regulator